MKQVYVCSSFSVLLFWKIFLVPCTFLFDWIIMVEDGRVFFLVFLVGGWVLLKWRKTVVTLLSGRGIIYVTKTTVGIWALTRPMILYYNLSYDKHDALGICFNNISLIMIYSYFFIFLLNTLNWVCKIKQFFLLNSLNTLLYTITLIIN